MLKASVWNKLKEKIVKLPAKARIKELNVLLTQTSDKKIISEIKDLIEKAKTVPEKMPFRERYENFTLESLNIESKFTFPVEPEPAAAPKTDELEKLVGGIQKDPFSTENSSDAEGMGDLYESSDIYTGASVSYTENSYDSVKSGAFDGSITTAEDIKNQAERPHYVTE